MNIPLPQSERLTLRRVSEEDIDDIFALHSDPEVMKYIRPPDTDKQTCLDSIRKQMAYYAAFPGLGLFAAIENQSNQFIGWFMLKHLDQTNDIELGYRLLKQYWGKGYATEMGQQLIRYGLDGLKLTKIVGITHPDNQASQRVLQKCGLRYIRDAVYYNTPVKYFELNTETNMTGSEKSLPASKYVV